jgi:ADP-ribosyl-[dinitrogen reductase] hydrolase
MNDKEILDRVQSCLLGVAIGDAMGMPVETMTDKQILAVTNNLGVSGFIDPVVRKDWNLPLKAGDTTDDWQLARAVAVSIIRTGGKFSLMDCAEEHVREYDKSIFGWGRTTNDAIKAIKCGERKVGIDWLPPAKQGKGCGNGVIMKVAPLAIGNFLLQGSSSELWHDVKTLGLLTHPDVLASIAAYAVAIFIKLAMTNSGIMSSSEGLEILSDVINDVRKIEIAERINTESVSDRLELIEESFEKANELREAVGCGFHSIQTAAFTIGTFLRHPKDFRAAILEAVNAGGDTDTNASVVGAMAGANCGLKAILEEWKNFSPDFKEPLSIGSQLFYSAINGSGRLSV